MKLLFTLFILFFPIRNSIFIENIETKTVVRKTIPIQGTTSKEDESVIRIPNIYELNAFIENTNLFLETSEIVYFIEIKILDMRTGEIIYLKEFVERYNIIIDISGLNPGSYHLELVLNDKSVSYYGDFNF